MHIIVHIIFLIDSHDDIWSNNLGGKKENLAQHFLKYNIMYIKMYTMECACIWSHACIPGSTISYCLLGNWESEQWNHSSRAPFLLIIMYVLILVPLTFSILLFILIFYLFPGNLHKRSQIFEKMNNAVLYL